MTQEAKDRYDAWATELGYQTGGGTKTADNSAKNKKAFVPDNFGDNKKTTTSTTTPTGVTQGSTTAKDTTGYPDVSQGSTIAKTTKDPRVGTPNSMIDPSEFAKAIKGSGTAVGKLASPQIGRTTKNFDEFMNRQPKNTRTQAFQNLERNKEMAKAINEMSEGATNIPTSYGITDDIYSNFNDNNDDPGAGGTSSSSSDSGSSDMGFSTASGGFIQRKNLPKANKKKKMKQGGLASRK